MVFLNRPLFIVSISAVVIFLVRFFPLEIEHSGQAFKWLFYTKISLSFAALCVPLIGMGDVYLWLVRRVCSLCSIKDKDPHETLSEVTPSLISGMFGALAAGFLMFVFSLPLGANRFLAWVVLSIGFVGFASKGRVKFKIPSEISHWKVVIVGLIVGMLVVRAMHFQNHEDAYLYHLSLSESWIHLGRVGVVFNNIYSGYAGLVEHYDLFLKLIFGGNAEQNAIAQLSHFMLAGGCTIWVVLKLLRAWVVPLVALSLFFLFLNPGISHAFFLPKNDGFLAAIILLATYACVKKQWSLFIAAAGFAFATKVTGAIGFLGLGLSLLIFDIFANDSIRRLKIHVVVLSAAAFWMMVFWSPFAINNFLKTKNPFFPLLNEVFHSPFAPDGLGAVVAEMSPFAITVQSLFESFKNLILFHPLMIMLALFFCFAKFSHRGQKVFKEFAGDAGFIFTVVFALIYFICLLVILGPFGFKIEHRHFSVVLILFEALGVVVVYRVLIETPWKRFAPWVLLLVGLLSSGLDAKFLQAWTFLKTDSVSEDLFSKKPVIGLNHELSKMSSQPIRLLALSYTNTSYFLERGEFWHHSMSFPAWKLSLDEMSREDWRDFVRSNQVSHILLEEGFSPGEAFAFARGLSILLTRGKYSVFQIVTQ